MKSLAERFEEKILYCPVTGCWLWLGAITPNGYGKFSLGHKTCVGAHRWSYENHVGPIPDGLQIDHLCRTRSCVNPDHLEPVTCRENLLRGSTFNARNAQKTHCDRGHKFTPENIYQWRGRRVCRECSREAVRLRRAKARASRAQQASR